MEIKKTKSDITKWVISENSSLSVNGSTNINKFSCEIPSCDLQDTIIITRGKTGEEIKLSGSINQNIQKFDCHNDMMTNNLRKTLKEKEFPQLHIAFLSLNELPDLTTKPAMITGLVDIEIAGTTKHYEVNYTISEDAEKVIHLLGTRDVNFSDFKLTPPKKLGGLVKTKNKLSVQFHLRMKGLD